MDRVIFSALATTLIGCVATPSAFAASPHSIKIGSDIWWGSTKVDHTRRGWVDAPSLYLAYHPSRSALPDMSYRYTSVDSGEFAAFDKHDLSFYYNLLTHDLMTFDVGLTATQYTDTRYRTISSATPYKFNDFTLSLYSYADIRVPDTQLRLMGQFEAGNMNGIKSTDFIAGLRYDIPFDSSTVSFRGGYRVIDLEFSDLTPSSAGLAESLVLVDGYFIGAEISF
ncbi:TIGR04219 family outer membrane beta-barrel protein [Vibrio profundum]|uniref:TIGR04219 family outer membrane beta-barrel protein n=1 Tax=Vibrio profundum TaxID=2910247 RepID=UPI003D0B8D23